MPELPEVETICRGIKPHLVKQTIHQLIIRERRLRWPVATTILQQKLTSQTILNVTRRSKYIYIHTNGGYLIIHLGMSGTLRIITKNEALKKHDHFDCQLHNGKILRFNDPRRFGSLLWAEDPLHIPMIANLGPEPLTDEFTANYLFQKAQSRQLEIKNFIMNNQVVVGVGNIYASESLFIAGIHPQMSAKQLTLPKAKRLHNAIQSTLRNAIEHGGTTLKDFCQSDGKPGYFDIQLKVYGRKNAACVACRETIQAIRIGQRMTYFCPKCQAWP